MIGKANRRIKNRYTGRQLAVLLFYKNVIKHLTTEHICCNIYLTTNRVNKVKVHCKINDLAILIH